LKGTVLSRSKILKLAERLESEETRVVNIYGQSSCGKSTLAISLGHEMESLGVPVQYLDLSETHPLSTPSDVTRGYICTDELVEWAADLSTDTLLILDNCKLPESTLSNMLVQLYEATEINLKIVVTTSQTLTKFSIYSFQLKELDPSSAITLLRKLTTIRLSDKMGRELTHLADYDPLTIKIISGLLSHVAIGDIISALKMSKLMASSPKEVPIQLSHNQMNIIGKGCARYLSMFPASFDNEAAQQVLSSSGFSDPSYCVQILSEYSLIEQYIHYEQQRFKVPKVVRDFYTDMRRERENNEHETATFQRGFKKYYTQLVGSLTNKEDDLQLLRTESHNIRFFIHSSDICFQHIADGNQKSETTEQKYNSHACSKIKSVFQCLTFTELPSQITSGKDEQQFTSATITHFCFFLCILIIIMDISMLVFLFE